MTSIAQTVPNYIFGISEQPDYLKKPGQVVDSVNMTPDVTAGLTKRPGSEFIANVNNADDGTWFNYYRSDAEQYIGHIQENGFVSINNVDGTACTITQLAGVTDTSTAANYLTHTAAEQLQTITINDYTFVCNRTTNCAYTAALSDTPPNEGFIELKVIAYGRQYQVELLNADGTVAITAEITTTADSSQQIEADTVLDDLVGDINGNDGFTAVRIGSGIHVTRTSQFSMRTSDTTVLNVFTDQVNNVERLPYQCHHGYLVKIINSSGEEDDFYAIFEGKNSQDGEGVWQETVGWNRNVAAGGAVTYTGINTTIDPATMPHVIIATALNTFTVAPCDGTTGGANLAQSFTQRTVGDEGTNPTPSFIGNPINNMILFRNRLGFLSQENVIFTTSGGLRPIDFWSTSALTSLATDPIDISASSKQPAILWDAVEVNNGLILFAENQQYLMTTDSDLLTQETTKLNSISYYQYSRACQPVSMGTTIGFIDNTGSNFRFFEMSNIQRDGEPTLIEQSKPVSKLTTDNIFHIADSRESSIMFFASSDDASRRTIWGYRYFQQGEQRALSSWFKYQMPGRVLYHCVMRDVYYCVIRYLTNGNGAALGNKLLRWDIKTTDDTEVITINDRPYLVYLDNKVDIAAGDLTYSRATDETTFTIPNTIFTNAGHDLHAYVSAAGARFGSTAEISVAGTTGTLEGDWTGSDIHIGYLFRSDITVPQFYVTKEISSGSFRADSRASLIIHRMFVETGPIGSIDFTLERLGKPDYTEKLEANLSNMVIANAPTLAPFSRTYLPAYERNTALTLKLSSEHPSPFALYSITWEGDYSNKYYRNA